ncbi:MAG: ABC transporter ATP-binding protein [Burkholderiaceae bacterium]
MSRVEISRVEKSWGDFKALNDVSFDVAEQSLTVLLGPSGCGKSTLLRLIAGLDTATGGQIMIGPRDVTHLDASKRGVSMVFQSYALFPHLTVRENILFGLKVRRVSRKDRDKRLLEAAETVGLDALLDRKPANLSGGQRQRVALARTIVSQQPVCLMDEPLSNLDAKLRAEMRDEIRDLQRQLGLTMIYVTHDQVEAMSMADQIVLLKDGSIEQIGTPHELYETPQSVFVARFIGVPPMNVVALDDKLKAQLSISQSSDVSFIGVRPEQLQMRPQGLELSVRSIDYLGGETVIRAVIDAAGKKQDVFVKVAGRTNMKAGEQFFVGGANDDLHFFNHDGQATTASVTSTS